MYTSSWHEYVFAQSQVMTADGVGDEGESHVRPGVYGAATV